MIFAMENVIQLKETTKALFERGAFICVGSCIESHTDNINYYIAIVSSNTLYYILKIIIIYRIDTKTGAKKHLGSPVAKELSAQQLSSIDSVNKVYYLLDFNETSKNPNLLGSVVLHYLPSLPPPFPSLHCLSVL